MISVTTTPAQTGIPQQSHINPSRPTHIHTHTGDITIATTPHRTVHYSHRPAANSTICWTHLGNPYLTLFTIEYLTSLTDHLMVLANYLSVSSQLFAFGKGLRDAPARFTCQLRLIGLRPRSPTLISLASGLRLIFFPFISCIFTK